MIYLIQVRYEKQVLLKIGYTEDTKKQTRYTSYRLHNPLFEVIFEIPEATEEHEKLLQKYFNEYQYQDYGNEWFRYSEEIVDYFKAHRTLESLQDLYNKGIIFDRSEFNRFKDYTTKVVTSIINLKVSQGDISLNDGAAQVNNLVDNILVKNRIRSYSRLWKYIGEVFGYKEEDLSKTFTDEVENFLRKFEESSYFTDKMRLLCESSFIGRDLEDILNCIPMVFKNYYITLGKDKIMSLGCQKSKLDLEYGRLKNNQQNSSSLDELIYSEFKVGEKYLKSDIKNKLGGIYSKSGIMATAKATDLENYFELKSGKATNKVTGKRDHYYEILKPKTL